MRIVPALSRVPADSTPLRCWASGVAPLDAALAGGFAYGRLHEVHNAEADDAATAMGFAAAIATGMTRDKADGGRAAIVWLRTAEAARRAGAVQAAGWAELGGQPGDALISIVPDARALLQAALDALRCAGVGVVILETLGVVRAWDLTASRRLALAAEKSGVPLFLLRINAVPTPSAAQTRWQVAAAPSHSLPGQAPGHPTFDISLLRQRAGPTGFAARLEWNRDDICFRDAAHSGAVVSVPARRPAADQRTRTGERRGADSSRRAA